MAIVEEVICRTQGRRAAKFGGYKTSDVCCCCGIDQCELGSTGDGRDNRVHTGQFEYQVA